ncbi:hypothetical protein CK231_26265 [Mesorhizobium loti]|uniref:Uncharacterized protein n=1 Tax=Rhizobium loti TaxID=381 RepID=A0A1A5IC74_RHILI|nr:hypothetical protein BAE41_17845 [Mesorhizobium loti]QGX79392.1 hypothetical protein EB234_22825 [Mesorhizobium japonicum R7A]OBP75420.1 hypothetical protein BAE42_07525 [Mesorhizobium loti]OBP76834.1 hypothetical protein BAE39_12195 [Mesorhizobium loti]OBP86469.1 hypothetical protein BAE38_17855 [Mesorhizobium loti]
MPASSPSFEVDSVTISEYVSQDGEGNQTFVGVRVGPSYIPELPQALPAWFVTVVMRPKTSEFKFAIHVGAPNKKEMLRINFDYKADRVLADGGHLISAIQLPSIPFPGIGDYPIRVKDENGETVYRHVLAFRLGQPDKPVVKIDGRAMVNPQFLNPPTAPGRAMS